VDDSCNNAESAFEAEETWRVLRKYLVGADWRDRLTIMKATGTREILASRIYRAFERWVVIIEGDHVGIESAYAELIRNPRLTLVYLRPVLRERPDTSSAEWRSLGDGYPPAGPEHTDGYLSICCKIAEIEDDGYARGVLQALVNSEDSHVRERASSILTYLETNSIGPRARGYRDLRAWQDLLWIQSNYLRRGMSQGKIESLLGPGAVAEGHAVLYGATSDTGERGTLRLNYYEGWLDSWEWTKGDTTPHED
jgi:hypothetical protein